MPRLVHCVAVWMIAGFRSWYAQAHCCIAAWAAVLRVEVPDAGVIVAACAAWCLVVQVSDAPAKRLGLTLAE